MELPRRQLGDELLPPGELTDIRARLRRIASKHDLVSVVACAFDYRTRMLPFIVADLRMAPAGVRSIGGEMVDSGFTKTRIVQQQWNRNFRPSKMRLDGRVPDIFLLSSMQLHAHQMEELIRDTFRIDESHRPLIIVGGSKFVYEPWGAFSADKDDPWAADVAVTGEQYILLNLLEVLLSIRAEGEPMRSAFNRARDEGLLDNVPGLVYARGEKPGVAEELVDTGVQRLVGDLDEHADVTLGYGILEPPSRDETLSSRALPAERVRRYSPISSLLLTLGCKFKCPYCPIPAYNQRQFRAKSGERIADDIRRIRLAYGIRIYFGADDNFFNDKKRALDIVETLEKARIGNEPLRRRIRLATEVTVHDTIMMKDHLQLVRKAGFRTIWLGVEDMSGALVRKGQTADKTVEAFRLLRERGILPMPMMMHHDAQPLLSRGNNAGLLNQVRILKNAGAASMQVLMITPSPGSKIHEETYTSGFVYDSVGGRKVETYMIDGNLVVASKHKDPWKKQFNILAAYIYFYNPFRMLKMLVMQFGNKQIAQYAAVQVFGMYGLVHTIRRTLGWALRLVFGRIVRRTEAPVSPLPMRSPDGTRADHDVSAP